MAEISDQALRVLRLAVDVCGRHHAFTRGEIERFERDNPPFRGPPATGYEMGLCFALARLAEGDIEGAGQLLQEAKTLPGSPTAAPLQ